MVAEVARGIEQLLDVPIFVDIDDGSEVALHVEQAKQVFVKGKVPFPKDDDDDDPGTGFSLSFARSDDAQRAGPGSRHPRCQNPGVGTSDPAKLSRGLPETPGG